ncbi:MAG TPA: glutathione peroxidase [Spirochaetia bacterium]|nr:glutathione peroxidase [Spirochaetaceae bacterium]HPE89892.1 glutathione peroxidase [Spirochaetales bacterium]HRW25442.1 glutathione peroxidase [Spirochaetia bacterium]
MSEFYQLSAKANDGSNVSMSDYRGKAVLIVNTASKCGFTPQYQGLEELYKSYADRGLVVLGFPCDQFAHQEPGDDAEIASFCQRNFGVTFPLMAKVDVNGDGAHPVFKYLCSKAPGAIGPAVKWNFTKFLVSRDGATIKRYGPTVEPKKIEKDIVKALEA